MTLWEASLLVLHDEPGLHYHVGHCLSFVIVFFEPALRGLLHSVGKKPPPSLLFLFSFCTIA